jgi:anti-sigma factor RsiW
MPAPRLPRIATGVTEADLLAYVDGRLDARRRAEVEVHLAGHPDDAARVEADLAIVDGLKMLFGQTPLEPPGRPAAAVKGRRRRSPWLARAAMTATLLAGGFAGGWLTARLEGNFSLTAIPTALAAAQCAK